MASELKSRLDRLQDLLKEMNGDEELRAVQNFFIGSLAADTSDKVWDRAIRIARECVEKYIR